MKSLRVYKFLLLPPSPLLLPCYYLRYSLRPFISGLLLPPHLISLSEIFYLYLHDRADILLKSLNLLIFSFLRVDFIYTCTNIRDNFAPRSLKIIARILSSPSFSLSFSLAYIGIFLVSDNARNK